MARKLRLDRPATGDGQPRLSDVAARPTGHSALMGDPFMNRNLIADRCVRGIRLLVVGVLMLIAFGGCDVDETTTAVGVDAQLRYVYYLWEKDGRPTNITISRYMFSRPSVYFDATNIVTVGTNTYHCQFGASNLNLRTPGAMYITDEKITLWIRDKDGKVVVSPEKRLRTDAP